MPSPNSSSHSTNPRPAGLRTIGVLASVLPSPAKVLGKLDHYSPFLLRQLLTEIPLNRLFGEAIEEGEFDFLHGRTLRLQLTPGDWGITLGFWQGRLRFVEGKGETRICGTLDAFRRLAERREDPDQLFFQRKLVIEGDTELGLGVKNLLDRLEWNIRLPGLRSNQESATRSIPGFPYQ